ncbi:MAG: hypothetical protein IJ072_03025 [Oscillospiraceae bacterium]|nr:hypothetical protein [Oscillospiraceae bacterium]
MFGYIRPAYKELKVRQYEAYNACYCGLCRTLGEKYGTAARMVLNYDFVLLVMLMWQEEKVQMLQGRCPVKLCRKRPYCRATAATEKSAAMSVILAYHKFLDDIHDSGAVKSLFPRVGALMLKRAYKKAAGELPDFDRCVKEQLARLARLEKDNEPSVDKTADTFARILSAAANEETSELRRRTMEQTLYHIGRYIYIIDACDDLKSDAEAERYNPVALRYGIKNGELSPEMKDELETTLMHSRNLAGAAFELMPETPWSDIVRNIIAYGMHDVCTAVLSGTFRKKKTDEVTDR